MQISIIAAMAKNRVIGKGNKIPWKLSSDLKRFKNLTMGHPVIMGRKTYESIRESLGHPLLGRLNIVVTHQKDYEAEGCEIVHSLKDAFRAAGAANRDEAFVIGGAEIYKQALPLADKMYLTIVKAEIDGDAYFPAFNSDEWEAVNQEEIKADQNNQYPHLFKVFQRPKSQPPS